MSEELRRRRAALREELRALERELGEEPPLQALDDALREELASASEFVVLIDDVGRVVHHNRLQPGVSPFVGRSVFDVVTEAYRVPLRQLIERARRLGHPCPGRIDASGTPETVRSYHLWVVPLPVPISGATTTLIGFEATQLQEVERALQDERSVVHSLVTGLPDVMLTVDREHRITFVNQVPDGDMNVGEVIGTDVVSFVPEAERAIVRRAIDSVFEGGGGASYESHAQVADRIRWYSVRVGPIKRDGQVDRVCMVATDMTEQRERELQLQHEREALRQSEARFRTMIEHAPEALLILDADTLRFVDASDSACELFGIDRSELGQHGPIEFSPRQQPDGQSSLEAGRAHVERALQQGSARFEWVHLGRDGHEIISEVHLAALPPGPRRLIRGSVFDITERKRAERERALLEKELFQVQKMQAIGHLTGGVAHDFNNLLTVILSHVELLKISAHKKAKVIEHAHEIMAATRRAAALTQQLLAFARRQPLKPRRIDLGELVEQMQRLLTRTLGETIVVQTERRASLWDCEADRTQLENAILNLAINARDAMPAGGALKISLQNRHVQDRQSGAKAPPGRYVTISVADEGSGMRPEVAARAFEPFFTTKEAGGGSGMGLSMVYGFVKQSGGHVEIDSRLGEGTCVTLYLPAARGASLETRPPTVTPQRRGQDERILVVEDEPAVRTTIVQALQALGYRTVDAPDAASALQALEHTDEIALVLTDVVLAGGLSGVRLAERIAQAHPNVPVTFMSGHARDVVARDGPLPESAQLLKKPFTHGELAAAVRAAIATGEGCEAS